MRSKATVILLFFCCFTIHAGTQLDSLLQVLDHALLDYTKYENKKINRIKQLKETLKFAETPERRYELTNELYAQYKAYLCDSALYYLRESIHNAELMNDHDKVLNNRLELSYMLTSVGMYAESLDVLRALSSEHFSDENHRKYILCMNHVYGEMSAYSQDKQMGRAYWQTADAYKKQIYETYNPDSEMILRMTETSAREQHRFDEALRINDRRLSMCEAGSPLYALVTYHRSLIYRDLGDTEKEKIYLCLSALTDIRLAITDHASLWTLSQLLYEEGDVERSYRYIRFSWNATHFFNARLRSWQSAGILSLIDKNYQAMLEKQNNRLQSYLILISGLVFLLVMALFYIYRQMKRLAAVRNNLEEANKRLNALNEELHQSNKNLASTNLALSDSNQIKEEYIARFMKLCSTYIDKLDGYRRMVYKKLSTGQADELMRFARSQEALDKEWAELYMNFDTAFLHLFPNFVEQFNELLSEDEQIVPKKGELLNTELRIFALIRLGIDDSNQIADFLNYSVNTIYNYRAKVRNKSRVSRDSFEDFVRRIR